MIDRADDFVNTDLPLIYRSIVRDDGEPLFTDHLVTIHTPQLPDPENRVISRRCIVAAGFVTKETARARCRPV